MISKDKKYRLRMDATCKLDINKTEVFIFEIDANFVYGKYRVSEKSEWDVGQWTIQGDYKNAGAESCLDLIEISPYEDFKIDDKVLVWDNETNEKHKGHFAGISDTGKPKIWSEGGTSFTKQFKQTWNHCEKHD